MWLPKDERYLLQGYWRYLKEINVEHTFSKFDLIPLLSSPKNWRKIDNQEDTKTAPKAVKTAMDNMFRIWNANERLRERNLINLQENQHDGKMCTISLTLFGYDLARKYSKFLDRSGLWFAAYKDHWIRHLFTFIGGILVGVITKMIW